jgi:hypothetical protein
MSAPIVVSQTTKDGSADTNPSDKHTTTFSNSNSNNNKGHTNLHIHPKYNPNQCNPNQCNRNHCHHQSNPDQLRNQPIPTTTSHTQQGELEKGKAKARDGVKGVNGSSCHGSG